MSNVNESIQSLSNCKVLRKEKGTHLEWQWKKRKLENLGQKMAVCPGLLWDLPQVNPAGTGEAGTL